MIYLFLSIRPAMRAWFVNLFISKGLRLTDPSRHTERISINTVKLKVAHSCLTFCNCIDCNHQAPLSMEFSRQEPLQEWVAIPLVV